MINVEVVQDNSLWGKKIKKPEIFFKKIISFFPKSFKFKKKKYLLRFYFLKIIS